jgi:tRNA modification GTPase
MNTVDTIAALCTAPGGAISIIRISGRDALKIGNAVWKGKSRLSDALARLLNFGHCVMPSKKNKRGDTALAVYMPAPNTYTAEDVVEIHCHGGALVSREVLELVLSKGARSAEPGEFTFRAFMNGKLDLTQAEAVSDIITAHSDMALHIAEKQMTGVLGEKIREIRNELFSVLAECESHLDFGEEELNWEPVSDLVKKIISARQASEELFSSSREGVVLRDGIRIVIAGRPNAGKSSLLNLILGFDRAIVTQIPGTTRDTLEEFANIRNIPVKLIDTAGIREADDLIEGIGVEKSFESLKQAQIIIWVMDASGNIEEEYNTILEHLKGKSNIIALWNKSDLVNNPKLPSFDKNSGIKALKVSVSENEGIDKLFDEIEKVVWGGKHTEEPEVAVSSRHAKLLQNAIDAQQGIDENLESEEWELAAVLLRSAIFALGTITGEDADPDVLDDIFSRFCIGK